ncbi:hypothetical protein [Rhodobaculum claviforme]|uniref:Uncharacterized protein n=1 Tax=Rhodobaculum claviforme TaxID=1549854 RepID=A0A934TK09_9RHOB|nr:hypothetical protein [Rhodobaculum claviforme]MBK5926861.1 hypothetical protein [Rhodobaculum claviforme]
MARPPRPWDAHWRALGGGEGPWTPFWTDHRGQELPDGAWNEARLIVGPYGGVGAFDNPLDAMLQRARHILHREEAIGRARRISGKARISRGELDARLERLRQHVEALTAEAEPLIPARRRSPDEQALWGHLKALRRALAPGRHATEHEATTRQRLATLRHEAADAHALLGAMARAAAQGIDPNARLDLLSPEELAEVRDPSAPAVVARLTQILRLGDALHAAGAEATHLLVGLPQPQADAEPVALDPAEARARAVAALLALDPTARPDLLTEADIDRALGMATPPPPTVQAPGPGPHERRRERWLAAHLLGLAVGLGVQEFRQDKPGALAAPDLLTQMKLKPRLRREFSDPTARALIDGLPDGIEGVRHLQKNARNDPLTRDAIATGKALGRQLRLRKSNPDAPPDADLST